MLGSRLVTKPSRAERRARSRQDKIIRGPVPYGSPVGIGRFFGAYALAEVAIWEKRLRERGLWRGA